MREDYEMTDKARILAIVKEAYIIDYNEIKKRTGLNDRVTKRCLNMALIENSIGKRNFKIKGIGGRWIRKYISRM